MTTVREHVRVGVAVKRPEIRFRLQGAYRVYDHRGEMLMVLEPGAYTARTKTPGLRPTWGAKCHTFSTFEEAEKLQTRLKEYEIDTCVIPMGRPAQWGAAGEFYAVTHAVVFGESESDAEVLEEARRAFAGIPVNSKKWFPGLPHYADQWQNFEPIRMLPPEGGELEIVNADGRTKTLSSPLRLKAMDEGTVFEIGNVRIGIEFHWDHEESLPFRGRLDLVADGESITAVNVLQIDQYLASVLGSEMRRDWPVEALAAQAVAARSTVMATRGRHHYNEAFELCHDDHCQCYQGISRESSTAREALKRVEGLLLIYGSRVADARYAKTCGGLSDTYDVAWDDEEVPYLRPVLCGPIDKSRGSVPSYHAGDGERTLHAFLDHSPDWCGCNPDVEEYPASAKEMEKLYRWRFVLAPEKVAELVEKRTGVDVGEILELKPLEFGVSGRIRYLRILGKNGTVTVGKELKIRRLLSETHLPSSAFVVSRDKNSNFVIDGIGWGHGVGLCQLGAAALARNGWKFKEILSHYYPDTTLVRY